MNSRKICVKIALAVEEYRGLQAQGDGMKYRDILLLCSVSFAAGMVVPFALLEMNARKSPSTAVTRAPVAVVPTQQVFTRLPSSNTPTPIAQTSNRQPTATAKVSEPLPETKAVSTGIIQAIQQAVAETERAEKSFDGLNPVNADIASEDIVSKEDAKIIGDIQTELLIRGYKPGIVDGKLGPGTRSAIKALQRDRGLAETGTIDRAILKTLNIKLESDSLISVERIENLEPGPVEAAPSVVSDNPTENSQSSPTENAQSAITVNGTVISVPSSAGADAKRLTPDRAPQSAGTPVQLHNTQQ